MALSMTTFLPPKHSMLHAEKCSLVSANVTKNCKNYTKSKHDFKKSKHKFRTIVVIQREEIVK